MNSKVVLSTAIDFLSGIFNAVQLHNSGEDGAMAVDTRVDCHLLHPHTWQ